MKQIISKVFAIRYLPVSVDVVLLFMRLIFGYAFILHGSVKILHPLNWMGNESSYAGIFQALAAISEFIGGFASMLGLLTRIAAFGIGCTMIAAVYVLHFAMAAPFIDLKGGTSFELPAVLFLIALLLAIIGPGRFSLDYLLFRKYL